MHTKQLIDDKEKSARFIKTFELYRTSKIITNVGELCENLEYAKPTLFVAIDGKRNVPNNLIYKFCEYYKLDPAYFFGRSSKLQSWNDNYKKKIKGMESDLQQMKADITKVLEEY